MTECRRPEFCGRYKLDHGFYGLEPKRILPRKVKQKDVCVYIRKNHYCGIWKKRRDSCFNGVKEIKRIFKYMENRINENKLKQGVR